MSANPTRTDLEPRPVTTTARPGVGRLGAEALRCLYQHRLLSTGQLHRLLAPDADASYLRAELGRLRRAGLATATRRAVPPRDNLWHATDAGADLVEATGELPRRAYRMDRIRASGALQQHTLAVNDTGLAFVEAARRLGHACGPLDWTPEVAHRLSDGSRAVDRLIVDAVLHYAVESGTHRTHHTVFVEVDRATMTVARLADKLTRYARYHAYVPGRIRGMTTGRRPAWQYTYPRFPQVLVVLTGADERRLQRRIADLCAYATALPQLHQLRTAAVPVGATTLTLLTDHGPHAPIVTPILTPSAPRAPLFTDSSRVR